MREMANTSVFVGQVRKNLDKGTEPPGAHAACPVGNPPTARPRLNVGGVLRLAGPPKIAMWTVARKQDRRLVSGRLRSRKADHSADNASYLLRGLRD
jgi:hypothetical protein